MERRNKIIIISAIIITLLVALFLFFFNKKSADNLLPPVNEVKNENVAVGKPDVLPAPSPARINNDNNYPLGLESFTSSYAERLASYSSDAKFKNLQDLKIISTSRMQSYLDTFIASSLIGKNGYEVQEARALNNQIITVSEDQAKVVVSLQLTKFSGDNSNPTTSYSKIELNVLKVGQEWQVDEVKWQ